MKECGAYKTSLLTFLNKRIDKAVVWSCKYLQNNVKYKQLRRIPAVTFIYELRLITWIQTQKFGFNKSLNYAFYTSVVNKQQFPLITLCTHLFAL